LQAEPAFDSPTAVQTPPNPIRLFLFTTSAQLGDSGGSVPPSCLQLCKERLPLLTAHRAVAAFAEL